MPIAPTYDRPQYKHPCESGYEADSEIDTTKFGTADQRRRTDDQTRSARQPQPPETSSRP